MGTLLVTPQDRKVAKLVLAHPRQKRIGESKLLGWWQREGGPDEPLIDFLMAQEVLLEPADLLLTYVLKGKLQEKNLSILLTCQGYQRLVEKLGIDLVQVANILPAVEPKATKSEKARMVEEQAEWDSHTPGSFIPFQTEPNALAPVGDGSPERRCEWDDVEAGKFIAFQNCDPFLSKEEPETSKEEQHELSRIESGQFIQFEHDE